MAERALVTVCYWCRYWYSFLDYIYFMGNVLGVSSSFLRLAGYIESVFMQGHFLTNEYFAGYFDTPLIDWQFALVVSIFVGSFLAAYFSGSFIQGLPSIWTERFGILRSKRALVAFIGGCLVLFGARFAGGCTSEHGISGTLQLALSGWLFLVAVCIGGVGTALVLYKSK